MELKRNQITYTRRCVMLLIVPYGIETLHRTLQNLRCNELLIVPYGIETSVTASCRITTNAFNRTLWN